MPDFFALEAENVGMKSWWWLELDPAAIEADPKLEDEVYKGVYSRPAPVPLTPMRGSRCPDYGSSALLMDIVTDRVLKALVQAGCTGFDAVPVVVRDRRGRILDSTLHWIRFSESRVVVDEGRGYMLGAGFRKGPAPPMDDEAAARAESGVFLDSSSWTGQDLFLPQNAGVRLLSEKAAGVLRKLDLQGAHVVPAELVGLRKNLSIVAFRREAGLARPPRPPQKPN